MTRPPSSLLTEGLSRSTKEGFCATLEPLYNGGPHRAMF